MTRTQDSSPSSSEDNATPSSEIVECPWSEDADRRSSSEDGSVTGEDHKMSDVVDAVADPVHYFSFALRKASSDPSTASRFAKDVARTLDPNRGLCFVTLHNNDDAVLRRTYLIPQSDRSEHTKLTSLEWAWGMPYFSLNVDEPANMIRLKLDLHLLFDRGQFIFLPSINFIELFYERKRLRRKNPNTQLSPITDQYNGQTIFEYRLVPLGSMSAISRAPRDLNASTTISVVDLDDEVLHHYPFSTLPVLRSHVLPHFVLYSSGRELVKRGKLEMSDEAAAISAWNAGGFAGTEYQVAHALDWVRDTYLSWIGCVVPPEFTAG
ncbi:hypothetical protein EW146_g4861 [Bondarzewia mesenterica]|uniref:HNH nuclease domain-containing protein n=1 Tax=Bondarzewia mesenterica TaxID=1095465 RepID=A0A4S4LV23_9AGAM|nr:hypothetical protein EW146_g4861 [Bondarzewia mesenterica]